MKGYKELQIYIDMLSITRYSELLITYESKEYTEKLHI